MFVIQTVAEQSEVFENTGDNKGSSPLLSVLLKGLEKDGLDYRTLFFTSKPAANEGGGFTILGCDVSSPNTHVHKITPNPSFSRRLTNAIAKGEWRPYLEKAAKRVREWLDELRRLCRLRETERKLRGILLGVFCGQFSLGKRNKLCFQVWCLKERSQFSVWLTPSVPLSLRAPTFSL